MKSVRGFVLAFAIAFALLLCTGAALVIRQVEAFGLCAQIARPQGRHP